MGSCRSRTSVLIAALLLPGLWAGAAAAACDPAVAELRGSGPAMRFSIELADDAGERARGLMFRESMAASAGMLFVYEHPQHAVFWMKNTLIPLDMIFADVTGRVTHVHSGAIPHDETPIDGGTGVQYVLEINGGLASALGIAPGHALRHPSIPQDVAAWRCDAQ